MSWRDFKPGGMLRPRPTEPRYKIGQAPSWADWNDALFTSMEASGPVNVFKGSILLGAFPWHTHFVNQLGKLTLLDVLHDFRVIREFEAGTWDVCGHRAVPMVSPLT